MSTTPSPTAPLPPTTWTFEWQAQKVGLLQREELGWVLLGRPHFSPETGWVVAHDVFHHGPDDRGSYVDEVRTFGAETWFDEGVSTRADMRSSMADSWMSVMGLVVENGSRGPEGLVLKNPVNPEALDHPLAYFWRGLYELAVQEAQYEVGAFGEPETWEKLKSEDQVLRAVSLAHAGYEHARARWPDIKQARKDFQTLKALASQGEMGEQLVVEWDGQSMSMSRHSGPEIEVQQDLPLPARRAFRT